MSTQPRASKETWNALADHVAKTHPGLGIRMLDGSIETFTDRAGVKHVSPYAVLTTMWINTVRDDAKTKGLYEGSIKREGAAIAQPVQRSAPPAPITPPTPAAPTEARGMDIGQLIAAGNSDEADFAAEFFSGAKSIDDAPAMQKTTTSSASAELAALLDAEVSR